MKKLFGALLWIGLASPAFAQDLTNDLYEMFGGSCSSSGIDSQVARNMAANFESLARNLGNNEKCNGLRAALESFQKQTSDFNAFQRNRDVAYLESLVADLELAISTEKASGNQVEVAVLQARLAESKVDLISKRQSQDYKSQAGRIQAVQSLDAYVGVVLKQLAASKECTDKKPNLIGQIASQMMSVTSNLMSGPTGSYLLLGSTILSSIVDFAKSYPISQAISDVNLNRKGEAIGCSFEGLANAYCKARDIRNLVNTQTEASACTECQYNQGLKILNDDLNAFITWAYELSAGSPPTTAGQASDKKAGEDLRGRFANVRNDLLANLAIEERAYNELSDPTEKKDKLRNSLSNVANLIAQNVKPSNCGFGPCPGKPVFSEEFSEDPDCGPAAFLMTGTKKTCSRPASNPNETCLSCVLRENNREPPPFDQMRGYADELLKRARGRVDRETARTNVTDPVGLIAKLRSPYGVGNHKPIEFLQNTRAYFEERLSNSEVLQNSPALRQSISEAKKKIDDSLAIESSTNNFSANELGLLSGNLIPERDIFYLSNNLNELIKQEFAAKAKEISKNSESLKWLTEYSVNETMNQLLAIYANTDQMANQSEQAMSQNRRTLIGMGQTFGETFTARLKDLSSEGNSRLSALNCLRALIIPGFEKRSDLKELCQGKTYRTTVPGMNLQLSFDQLANEKSEEKRICAIYDFSRRIEIESKFRKKR
jgi:hypothetical protein